MSHIEIWCSCLSRTPPCTPRKPWSASRSHRPGWRWRASARCTGPPRPWQRAPSPPPSSCWAGACQAQLAWETCCKCQRQNGNLYFEKISSSILLVGLARVSIFQLMSTDERSPILTCLIDLGQGSENWKGGGGTTMLPGILVEREESRPVSSVTAVAASLITSSSFVLFLRDRLVDWNNSLALSEPTPLS